MSPTAVSSSDGVEVMLHHFGGDGPAVLFCHATGFHGLVWTPIAETLSDDFDCYALDLRGHGDSVIPAGVSMNWRSFGDDVLAAADYIGAKPLLGVGHSMGGAAIALAELAKPGTFARAYLYEPILYPSDRPGRRNPNPLAEGARRRTEVFESVEHAFNRYASRPPLGDFDPRSLRAYVEHGLESIEGGVRLKCRGPFEADVFEHSQNGAFEHLHQIETDVVVAAGGEADGAATFAPMAAEELRSATLKIHDELDHFGPMTHPDLIAEDIRSHLLGRHHLLGRPHR